MQNIIHHYYYHYFVYFNYLKDYLPRFSGREGEGDMSAPTFLYSLNIQT